MLYLKKTDYEKIVAYAKQELPNEACGLLGGRIEGADTYVETVYLLTNLDKSNEHFSMDPKEQLATIKDIRAKGHVLIGNFHSHPETPSRPSEEDKRLAYDSKSSYLILSLEKMEEPVLRSFLIDEEKRVSVEEISIGMETTHN